MDGGMKNRNPSSVEVLEKRCDIIFTTLTSHISPSVRMKLNSNVLLYNFMLQLMNAIQVAEQIEKPLLADLFTDVYHEMPSNLQEQERSLTETMKKHPQDFPSGFAV